MSELGDKIRELAELQKRQKDLKEQLSGLNMAIDRLSINEIPDLMDELGFENLKVEGVGRISCRSDLRIHVPAAQREALYEWLENTGNESLIASTVNASTLKAFVKESIKRGTDIPDDLINVTPYSRAVITKS